MNDMSDETRSLVRILLLGLCVALMPAAVQPVHAGWLGDMIEVAELGKSVSSAMREMRSVSHALETARKALTDLHRVGRGFVILPIDERQGFRMVQLSAEAVEKLDEGLPLGKISDVDIIIPEQYIEKMQSRIGSLWARANVHILTFDGSLLPVETSSDGKQVHASVRVDKKVFLELNDRTNFGRFQSASFAKISRTDARVISFFDRDEIDTVRKLDMAVGDIHTSLAPDRVQQWIQSLERWNNQVIFFVGHVEKDTFVMRDQRGAEMARLPISDIMTAAAKSHSSVLLLGCETAGRGRAGYQTVVNIDQIANALSGLHSDTTYGDLFRSLARASPDGLRFDDDFSQGGMLGLHARAPVVDVTDVPLGGAVALQVRRVDLTLPTSAAPAPLFAGLAWMALYSIPFAVGLLGIMTIPAVWAYGLLRLLAHPRRSWANWNDAFPGKATTYSRTESRVLWFLGRRVMFVLVFPFVSATQAIYDRIFRFSGVFLTIAVLGDSILDRSYFLLVFLCGPGAWLLYHAYLKVRGLRSQLFDRWLDLWAVAAVCIIASALGSAIYLTGVVRLRPEDLPTADLHHRWPIIIICGVGVTTGALCAWVEQKSNHGLTELPGRLAIFYLPSRIRSNIERPLTALTRS